MERTAAYTSGCRRGLTLLTFGALWLGLAVECGASGGRALSPNAYFEPNRGQAAAHVAFLSRAVGYTVALDASGGAVYALPGVDGDSLEYVRMSILDAAPLTASGERPLPSATRWYGSSDASLWLPNLPHYASVRFAGIRSGVDLVWRSQGSDLQYEFAVAPGADPSQIRFRLEGARRTWVDDAGDLRIEANGGTMLFRRPYAYQPSPGGRREVGARFVLDADIVRFELAVYDPNLELVIDPTLRYLSYIGGSGFDAVYAVAADSGGNIYIAGETASADFLTSPRSAKASRDAFVTKLSPDGGSVVYTTILAGKGNDSARALAARAAGGMCVAGSTSGGNFPVKNGAFSVYGGMEDAFAACLDSAGLLSWATYLGGGGGDVATGIGLDSAGNVYVGGFTSSTAFPTTAGAPQQAYRGGMYDAFLAKLTPAGSALSFSTLLGGSGNDQANGLAVDASGKACIAGRTDSTDLLTTSGAYQTARNGGGDAFAACLAPGGTSWSYITYLGGTSEDLAYAIALDSAGNAYLAGATYSPLFPVSSGAAQTAKRSDYDAFVTKLNAAGTSILYSTLLGGGGVDSAMAIAVEASGAAWVAGFTSSVDFPLSGAWQSVFGGAFDAFVAQLKSDGSGLAVSSYAGGSGDDRAMAAASNLAGGVLVGGYSNSPTLQVSSGAIQRTAPAGYNGFLAVVAANKPPTVTAISPALGSGLSRNFTVTAADPDGFGDIDQVILMVSQGVNGAASCSVDYWVGKNSVLLVNDAGSGWLPQTLQAGAAGTLANSQCTAYASAFSFSGSSATLTASISLGFQSGFAGSKSLYLYVIDRSGASSGWQNVGTWTVTGPNQAPAAGTLTPPTGGAGVQNFVLTASDPNGYSDIDQVILMFSNGLNGASSCSLNYWVSRNNVLLINDAGSAWLPQTVPAGTSATVANTQCTLYGAAFAFSGSGTTLTATASIGFQTTFSGVKNVYLMVIDRAGLGTGWQSMGTWTVPGVNQAPTAGTASPSSGSGMSQVFTLTASDPNGYADVDQVILMVSQGLSGAASCSVNYWIGRSSVLLINDAGSGWLAQTLQAGAAGTLANGQCTVQSSSFSSSGSGSTLTANVSIGFQSAFAGSKTVYLLVIDRSGSGSGWKTVGSWTVQ